MKNLLKYLAVGIISSSFLGSSEALSQINIKEPLVKQNSIFLAREYADFSIKSYWGIFNSKRKRRIWILDTL